MTDTPRVLIADDDAPTRALVAEVLASDLGAAVDEATDGYQAMRAAAAGSPDLVLLDLRLPVLDGFAVLRFLKGQTATARIPVLALTGAGSAAARHALDRGCAGVVAKPFDLDELVETVRPFLARKGHPESGPR
jgi:DNA-binding response OmpR family regulator